ncbi:hypothetical protein NIES4103_27480 [Nostoc sp. NIES-4103]|nr:hypothetical protein NIES4103_27480 [Nostoc sp. NIES-4103]
MNRINPMAEILLSSVAGITETSTDVTLDKASLAYTGYTPRATMTYEEFIIALVIKAGGTFTEAAQTADSDRQIVITLPTDDDISLTGTSPNRYAEFDYQITARKPAPTITISPLDF